MGKLRHYLDLTTKIISQTERRVLRGEAVPAHEKVLSLFEAHTDIIKKKRRETVFGHKLFLTGGASGLMLGGEVVRGNPNDAAQFQPWLQRQHDLYGRWPRQVSCDGCFASRPNLAWAKEQGIQDVAFAKKRGLKVDQMVSSRWVYRKLRCFRAGIEGCISWLERVFGVGRCTWKGWATSNSTSTSRSPASTCWFWPASRCNRGLRSIGDVWPGTRVFKIRDPLSTDLKFGLPVPVEPVYCSFSALLRATRSRKHRLYGWELPIVIHVRRAGLRADYREEKIRAYVTTRD